MLEFWWSGSPVGDPFGDEVGDERQRASLTSVLATVALGVAGLSVVTAVGQRGGAFRASRDHPAINYSKGPTQNAVASLDRQLQEGAVTLEFGGRSGYLTAVLQALDIPVESQVMVFSKTSRQAPIIDSKNPRAVFFNDYGRRWLGP